MTAVGLSTELSSTLINEQIDRDLARRAGYVYSAIGRMPTLSLMWVNPAHKPSAQYVEKKVEEGARLGFDVKVWDKPDATDMSEKILEDNANPDIHGVMTQLPFTEKDEPKRPLMLALIAPEKDVDGLGPRADYHSATANAILRLLRDNGVNYHTQPVGVGGDGLLAGAPTARLLKESGAQDVRTFNEHSDPLDIVEIVNRPIFVSAMGDPGVLTPDLYVSTEHRTILDAGTAEKNGRVRGDVDPSLRAYGEEHGWRISPLKGGLGPLTIRMLLANTVKAAEVQVGLPTLSVPPYITTTLTAPVTRWS